LQGENVQLLTRNGNISTNSSYATNLAIETVNGDLYLKNVHRNCEISASGHGRLTMSGFSGTLKARLISTRIKVHISDIVGHSHIVAKNKIAKMNIDLDQSVLDKARISIEHAKSVNATDEIPRIGEHFGTANEDNHLKIYSKGPIFIKKLSWADVFSKFK
jgi:DUF4097 and DUF4098 domain-containing protein YvlB